MTHTVSQTLVHLCLPVTFAMLAGAALRVDAVVFQCPLGASCGEALRDLSAWTLAALASGGAALAIRARLRKEPQE